MRKLIKWVFIAGIFVCIGLAIALVIAEKFHTMSDDKFCGSCHVMEPMVETWKMSPHGGNNDKGIEVKCASCHTPQSSVLEYTQVKITSGIRDVFNYHFNTPDADFFLENLDIDHAKKYVFESGCLSCHKNITDNEKMADAPQKIHASYFASKEESDAYSCINCHKDIAHPGLKQKLQELKITAPKE